MINLLPPETKQMIMYARRSNSLIKWAVATFAGICGIGVVVMAGYFYINQSTRAYAKDVTRIKQLLAEQQLEETQKRTEEISSSTKLALQVLSRQVLFSRLLKQIGAAMPAGSALQNLSISKLEGGLDLQAAAIDYQTATQVQLNLQDPDNKIFEKADIVNISCTKPQTETEGENPYPCQVSIRALFAKNSPFLFTTKTEDKAP